MLSWLLLSSLLSLSSLEPCLDGVWLCGPQNVTVNFDVATQTISTTWEDATSSSRIQGGLIYDVEVLLSDDLKKVHSDAIEIGPEQAGFLHHWTWTSSVPLECATHSVRLRSRYLNRTSQWSPLQGRAGTMAERRPEVFPKDRVAEVGSRFPFCCVLRPSEGPVNMRYHGRRMETTQISGQSHIITVPIQEALSGCVNVYCNTSSQSNGACVYVGYRPDDRALVCETRDLQSVECHWDRGRPTNLALRRRTKYTLNGRECPIEKTPSCKLPVEVDDEEESWTLTAQNPLGAVELRDRADLRDRVYMLAPVNVTASHINAREASLEWRWTQPLYSSLNMLCQVQLDDGGDLDMRNYSGGALRSVVVDGLLPAWTYTVTVRCGSLDSFWRWGEFSRESSFQTKEDTPEALDVWMHIEGNQTVIAWKTPPAKQSHGQIQDYEVTWGGVMDRSRSKDTIRPPFQSSPSYVLPLAPSGGDMVVTVTARNSKGSSPPSSIVIPSSLLTEREVNSSTVYSSEGGFNLTWNASINASCGYIVDWCPTFTPCNVEWMKVPDGVTSARIQSASFEECVRYTFSIYTCSPEAPDLLYRAEGYMKECIPNEEITNLANRQSGSSLDISWTGIPPEKQTAFVLQYVLTYFDNALPPDETTMSTVSTANPEDNILTVTNLHSKSYKFTLKALTSVGTSNGKTFIVNVEMQFDQLITVILLSMGAMLFFLSMVTFLCYMNWKCLKQEFCPDIPKPAWKEEWLIPLRNYGCEVLQMEPCHRSELVVFTAKDCGDQEKEGLENTHSGVTASLGSYSQLPGDGSTTLSTPSPNGTVSQPRDKAIDNPTYTPFVFSSTFMEHSMDYQPHVNPNPDSEVSELVCKGYQPQGNKEISSPETLT